VSLRYGTLVAAITGCRRVPALYGDMMLHVVSYSGGKDSTAMLLKMIETHMRIDVILHVDPGKEFPGMYSHIEQVREYIYPLKIETIKINYDYWFADHIKTKGKNKGKRGYGWPDFRTRWCTALKRDVIKRRLRGIQVIEYHGIAYDEQNRIKNKGTKYPLINWKITEKQALEYCYERGFMWDGLYEKFNRVSCWCCPLSRIGELRILHDEFPDLWVGLKAMDEKSYRRFRPDYTVNELEQKFT
jgi:3'-phosphoadenosine 5'-phosphosulfate sulfotransferase (PAPS reductase)/FAD synthetase